MQSQAFLSESHWNSSTFAQEVCEEAKRLASGYKDERYTNAAEELRFPYFDWALKEGSNAVSDELLNLFFDETTKVVFQHMPEQDE